MRDRRALRFFLVCMLFLPAVGIGLSAPASNKSTDSSPLSGVSPENSIGNFSLSTSLGRVVLNAGLQSKLNEQDKMRQAEVQGASETHRALSNILHDFDPSPLLAEGRRLFLEKGQEAELLLEQLKKF